MRSLNTTSRNVLAVLVAILAALPVAARAADADLELTLDAPSVFHYGETQTYTATVTNLGPSVADGVRVTDIT